jgi:hypothetical protein
VITFLILRNPIIAIDLSSLERPIQSTTGINIVQNSSSSSSFLALNDCNSGSDQDDDDATSKEEISYVPSSDNFIMEMLNLDAVVLSQYTTGVKNEPSFVVATVVVIRCESYE